ncbi:hypothetical protein EMA8858_02328 [Emticicia aquatica]|uniref:DUF3854 domain-containing protein n=1 Tax=Emticicia aquatica TaxID=1681835 RepID=A0ABN8EWS4_9BACT|nr:DUF5906 domain-containing protein [Emticicia aquatica]CAH0996198.1 hypothetical protein EMA8858_02328 [Emticicia aquatica]
MEKVPDNQGNTEKSYCEIRLSELGISPEQNKIITSFECFDDCIQRPYNVFKIGEHDSIEILFVGLDGMKTYMRKGKEMPYIRVRSNPESENTNKYKTPFGAKSEVFFPPIILEKYKSVEEINTLVITEGEFKAMKGSIHGIDCIGLSGIHNFTSEDRYGNKVLNSEIVELIKVCKIKNVILLLDNDCLTVKYEENKDLWKRPNSFFSAVNNFRERTKKLDIDVYFAHICTDLATKGLDDLMVANPGNESEIRDCLLSRKNTDYFSFLKFDFGSSDKLRSYFKINESKDSPCRNFYEFYKEILEGKEFLYNGVFYKGNESEVEEIASGEILNYCRVGDHYYKTVKRPTKDGKFEVDFIRRDKTTITDDLGRKALKKIAKYEDFTCFPSHIDYKQSINGFYNKYQKINFTPEKGNCDNILKLIRHIFGDAHYDFALDYCKLLYEKPHKNLPILLMESEERNTGKSTFGQLLITIFGDNAIKLGNSDLQNDFNSFWIQKLLMVVDETSLEKAGIEQMVKRLSTEKGKVVLNEKGKAQHSVNFFGKFIFITNEVGKALRISKGEIRYAVFRVSELKEIDPYFEENINDEIPAFLQYLIERTLTHKERSRMYFDFSAYETPYLHQYFEFSKPSVAKAISSHIQECFLSLPDTDELLFSAKDLYDCLKKQDSRIAEKDIREKLKTYYKIEPLSSQRYDMFDLELFQYDSTDYIKKRNGRAYLFERAKWVSATTALLTTKKEEMPKSGGVLPF